ncbi:hypothetical protein P5706_15650 [Pseudomonas sp. ChxA]|uniref:hypothetical protein n=1 Tax=Pseudomonas sp. ChxA TaxID=3035473 RepID=UPI002552C583|nr:hypothetical protein [Pseudomonas sp. ChxA]MDL2185619.1 hypothetical protein [Pseudomonas sp. ChxA]
MSQESDIDSLKRFTHRAGRIISSEFWIWMTRKRGQSDMARIIAGEWLAHDGLNIDELEAFCLNLRLLIQGRDGFCIRDIGLISDGWGSKHDDLKKTIKDARAELHKNLAAPSMANIKEAGEVTTNAELFDLVFYGGLVHEDKVMRHEFDRLVKSGVFSFFLFQSFRGVLFHYRNCIVRVGKASLEWLEREGHANDG